ncbi:MAG: alpha/beta hydrolase [Actinomycetota bacterium]|nr:alpha/beta hydrolase [Actinomycetota bacterium]
MARPVAVYGESVAPLAFTSKGTGQPVLLLHGQPGTSTVWFRLQPLLADAGFRAVAVDRPGYGQTGGDPAGFAGNAERAFALLDYLELPLVTIVGHSWAGAVAIQMALTQPDRVRGLVLQGSVGGGGSVTLTDRALALPVLGPAAFAAGLRVAAVGLRWDRIRHRMAPELRDLPRHRLTAMASSWSQGSTARAVASEQRSLVGELPAIQARLSEMDTPTVVLVGRDDRLVAPAAQRDLCDRLPHGEVVEVAGGHFLGTENPDAVLAAVATVSVSG